MIRLEDFQQWMVKAAETIQANKEYLTELDQAIGDGDHGINLARGFGEVLNKVSSGPYTDIGSLLQDTGMVLLAKVGGASGPLYGTVFIKAAAVLKGKQQIDIEELAHAFGESVNGIKTRGKAAAGDKTMLDVWEPVVAYMHNATEQFDGQELLRIAKLQMEETKQLEAKKGRAAYLGSRSVGHLDPGAVSSYLLFEALCQTLAESGPV